MQVNKNINKQILLIIFFVFISLVFSIQVKAASCDGTDTSCPTGQYCAASKLCKPQKSDVSPCASDNECISNSCTNNKCGKTDATKIPFEPIAPALQISIPTIQPFTTEGIGQPDAQGIIQLPFIGQYFAGLYQWALLVAGLICAVFIAIGGLMYITSSGDKQKITQAKDQITHALSGLLLLLSTYTILYIINPDLVQFKSSNIKVIERIDIEPIAWTSEQLGELESPGGKKYCGCIDFRTLYNTSKLKDAASISAKISAAAKDSPLIEYGNAIADAAKKYNMDPAFALAIWKVETRLGTTGVGRPHKKNIGSLSCGSKIKPGPNYTCDDSTHHFRIYQNYQDAINDWFATTDPTNGWRMWQKSRTVGQIMSHYAPPSENNTAAYIDRVSNFLISNNNATINDLQSGGCSCSITQ